MTIISYTCDRVNSYQFCCINKLYVLKKKIRRFNFEACNVCKTLMRGSHNLLVDVKVMKNIEGPSC
jgi:hypothetical protein